MNEWPLANTQGFHCACKFKRERDFAPTDLIEPCGYHADMARMLKAMTDARDYEKTAHARATKFYEGRLAEVTGEARPPTWADQWLAKVDAPTTPSQFNSEEKP
jgi:hypothetical protein